MNIASIDEVAYDDESDARHILRQLTDPSGSPFVVLRRHDVALDDKAISLLAGALSSPMAASASPVPTPEARKDAVDYVNLDARLPPAPSLGLPCAKACVFSREALLS